MIPLPNFVNKACNISAERAHKCQHCPPSQDQDPTIFPSTQVTVLHHGNQATTPISKHFLYKSYGTLVLKRLIRKAHWINNKDSLVSWHHFCSAMYQMTPEEHHHNTRISHKLWPTNSILARRSKHGNKVEKNVPDACPLITKTGTTFSNAYPIWHRLLVPPS
mmetsp:Transcript_23772/g.36087  ORF Transcript_23772/g.36087 Transcript_23772/m.36087 type:complete len:163 (+) Transcript_23772:660-1148(+)